MLLTVVRRLDCARLPEWHCRELCAGPVAAMDSLFATNPGAFAQVATHISLFSEPMSPGFASFVTQTLRDDVRMWRWHKYTLWNVTGLGELLGKLLPVDVHGWHVVLDEEALLQPSKHVSHSSLKYALLVGGQRRKEGGRKVYDFVTMNFGLAVGGITGLAFMMRGRKRFGFLKRRPIVSLLASSVIVGIAFIAVRQLFQIFAVGMWAAERSHHKALKRIKCVDCLDELVIFMDEQIADFKTSKLPEPMPGMPPIPEGVEAMFMKNMALQADLLRADQITMRTLQKQLLAASGVTGDPQTDDEKRRARLRRLGMYEDEKLQQQVAAGEMPAPLPSLSERNLPAACLCDVHQGLRADPAGYQHPLAFPIFQRDRTMAEGRVRAINERADAKAAA